MTWDQIPLKEQQALYKAFYNNPEIKKLQDLASTAQSNKMYIQALQYNQEVTRRWEYIKQRHCQSYDEVVEETVKISDLDLPEDIQNKLLENIITLFMCCDIIEEAHMNANDILKKFNQEYSMDNFLDLKDLVGNIKRKMDYLREKTSFTKNIYWGDSCDKHYQMMMSKARSIIKKKSDTEHWIKSSK